MQKEKMILRHARPTDFKIVKQVYKKAFPFIEKKPWYLLKSWIKKGKYDLLIGITNAGFAGFLITIPYKDIVLFDYLAANPEATGKGYGSEILRLAEKHYEGMRLCLVAEAEDDEAENKEQRELRLKFYDKNGWTQTNLLSIATSGRMHLYTKGEISAEEYLNVNKYCLGNFLFKLSKMHTEPYEQ